jgi:exodeoxyribonuclease-3
MPLGQRKRRIVAMRLVSWNVNGLRAVAGRKDWEWFARTDADVVALQETKARPEQLEPGLANPQGWHAWWSSSEAKKGYSGVAVFSRLQPVAAKAELPDARYVGEGRLLHLEFETFHFFNGYFPNGGAEVLDAKGKPTGDFVRLDYKMGFLDAFLKHAQACRAQKPVVVCGDFNIAHRPIDLARPEQNETSTGFLPVERAFLDRFTAEGYVDTFRHVHGDEPGQYSWWSYRGGARSRNVGWRLDYFFVSEELVPAVEDAWIENNVRGSDHCPVGLALKTA